MLNRFDLAIAAQDCDEAEYWTDLIGRDMPCHQGDPNVPQKAEQVNEKVNERTTYST